MVFTHNLAVAIISGVKEREQNNRIGVEKCNSSHSQHPSLQEAPRREDAVSIMHFASLLPPCFALLLIARLLIGFFFPLLLAGSLKTSFIEGSTFNVSWHLAYPHRVSTIIERRSGISAKYIVFNPTAVCRIIKPNREDVVPRITHTRLRSGSGSWVAREEVKRSSQKGFYLTS